MPFIPSKLDGASLHYRDYRPSQKDPFQPHNTRDAGDKPTLVFSAPWPFPSQVFDHLMLPLCESYGYRCVAVDRRGFGSSEWTGARAHEVDYETFADDLGHVVEQCDVGSSFIGIGASMGCGELLLMLHRHPKLHAACKGLVFLGPSLPIPMQTPQKSTGPPRSFWDAVLRDLREDRFARLASALSYVWGEVGVKSLSVTEKDRYEKMVTLGDPFALERAVQIFTNRDFTPFFQNHGRDFKFPVLIVHGDADAANPVESGPYFIRGNMTKVEVVIYKDAAHGPAATHKERCMQDILRFLEAAQ